MDRPTSEVVRLEIPPREGASAIKTFPTPPVTWRTKGSRLRALAKTMLGLGGGFFTQYAYVNHLQPVTRPYPEVEALCEASAFPELLADMRQFLPVFRGFGSSPNDPVFGRGMFPALDGMATYAAVRRFKPKRIMEIGSGDSTHFLARAVRDNGSGHITCIDPEPRRAIIDLDVDFKPRLMTADDAEIAGSLEPNDILFIDSSHIMLPGMDVDIQFNRMFPRLKRGVIVHVHDIFLPDDYPANWRHRNYTEQNALIGWLVSRYFEILWPGRYVITRHADKISAAFGDFDLGSGTAGSLWLRKT